MKRAGNGHTHWIMDDNTTKFEGLAETYDAYRPSYPSELFQRIVALAPTSAKCAVDVGAGTGISTAGLIDALPTNWLVIGVEPGEDMRRVLMRRFSQQANFQANNSPAEDLQLPDNSASIMTVLTAVHWFDLDRFLAEAARVLVSGGILAIGRNRRRPNPVVQAFDTYIFDHMKDGEDLAKRDRAKDVPDGAFERSGKFDMSERFTIDWSEQKDCDALIDLYLTRSTTNAVVRKIGLKVLKSDLVALYREHAGDQPVEIDWETSITIGRHRGAGASTEPVVRAI